MATPKSEGAGMKIVNVIVVAGMLISTVIMSMVIPS